MVPPQKKDGITPRSHAAGGPAANQGGREREDMVANIHEFVNDPVGEINGTAYHVSGRRDEVMGLGLIALQYSSTSATCRLKA